MRNPRRMMKKSDLFCEVCGVPNTPETNEALDDVYSRLRDGRSTYEPLVFTSDWLEENVMDEEDEDAVFFAMERNMSDRGLCVGCGRPDLSHVNPDDIMTEEEAKDLHEMWAEMAAERRMGA